MNDKPTSESAALTTSGIAGVLTAGGAVTFALFPLAIPFLLVTAVFVAPLALLGLAAALPIGVLAALVIAIRALARRATRHAPERPGDGRPRATPRGSAVGLGSRS